VTREFRRRFVERVYATHNTSSQIQAAISRCVAILQPRDRALNLGSGHTPRRAGMVNFDCVHTTMVDCIGMAERLPFRSDTFKVVITQETLEHVREPSTALAEIHRVMTPGGILYCQLPFVIGYHPGPNDFWRFSRQGIEEIVKQAGFESDEVSIAVGPATGFYRIAVEFVAVAAACAVAKLYIPAKATAALLFAPLKLLDPLLSQSAQADRLAGGYYVVAHKNSPEIS
jgi:SAM-dependent methyltransferase